MPEWFKCAPTATELQSRTAITRATARELHLQVEGPNSLIVQRIKKVLFVCGFCHVSVACLLKHYFWHRSCLRSELCLFYTNEMAIEGMYNLAIV
mmetsp:Transcript_60971/g.108761  ORF Transcript_60971/g.108761 Transcript_60971/m.108761 type:complete len:95 (-) Transcript_60971:6-290(-)